MTDMGSEISSKERNLNILSLRNTFQPTDLQEPSVRRERLSGTREDRVNGKKKKKQGQIHDQQVSAADGNEK